MTKESSCLQRVILELADYIDGYSYHDAQTEFYFYCDREPNHKGKHEVMVDAKKKLVLRWENGN